MILFVMVASSIVSASLYWLLRIDGTTTIARRLTAVRGRRRSVVAIVVAVPAATIALYAQLGRPDALTSAPDPVRAMATERTERLAMRMETQKDDVAGLRLLARSYEQLGRRQEAVATRRRLVSLQPDDPDALLDLAEAVALTQARSEIGEPVDLARRALKIDAANARALAVVANEAVQRDDLPTAIDAWQRILDEVDEGSALAQSLRDDIARARSSLAEGSDPSKVPSRVRNSP